MEDLQNKLDKLKNDFYKDNKKNTFIKNKQKLQCAEVIANNIDINTLLDNTFIIKNNKIIVQYPILKTYANYENFQILINKIFYIVNNLKLQYTTFELHVNMDTYTITAHERFKHMYNMFFELDRANNVVFCDKLINIVIYNSPSILSTLASFFTSLIKTDLSGKVKKITKKDTKDLFKKLIE